MTTQQIESFRTLATPAFVPPVEPAPFQIGRCDAVDGMDCNPSAYFHARWQRIAYVAGFASIHSEKAATTVAGTDMEVAL